MNRYHYIGVLIVMVGLVIASAEPINPSLSISLAGGIAGLATVAVGVLIYRKGDRYDRTI